MTLNHDTILAAAKAARVEGDDIAALALTTAAEAFKMQAHLLAVNREMLPASRFAAVGPWTNKEVEDVADEFVAGEPMFYKLIMALRAAEPEYVTLVDSDGDVWTWADNGDPHESWRLIVCDGVATDDDDNIGSIFRGFESWRDMPKRGKHVDTNRIHLETA